MVKTFLKTISFNHEKLHVRFIEKEKPLNVVWMILHILYLRKI